MREGDQFLARHLPGPTGVAAEPLRRVNGFKSDADKFHHIL